MKKMRARSNGCCSAPRRIRPPRRRGWFRALAPAKIAVLQNGIEHVARVTPIAGGAAILPVIVRCPVEPLAPGEVNQQGPASLMVPKIIRWRRIRGVFDGPRRRFHASRISCTEAWVKLCQNAVNGAVCGLTVRTIAVIREPLVADFARKLALECIAVGRAEARSSMTRWPLKSSSRWSRLPNAEHHGNSLYYDRRAGRPMEFEARNGVVVRLARKHGLRLR